MTGADPALGGVRLVATDLDGTVVRRDGTISARTVAALAAVEDAGLHLVLVTGRPPRWMRPISEATGHHGIAVCGNGAFVYDLHAERVVERFALEPAEGAEAVRRIRAVLPGAAFAVETGWGFGHEPSYEPNWPTPDLTRVVPVEDLVAEPVGKLLVRLKGSDGDAMLEAVAPVLSGLAEATHSNAGDCLLEVSARGVSKASTLARVCAERGVAAERGARLRRPAQRPADARLGRPGVRGGQRAPARPRVGGPADGVGRRRRRRRGFGAAARSARIDALRAATAVAASSTLDGARRR